MSKKLFLIKLIHTIIWFFYVCVIFYINYAAIYNKIDCYLWVAIGLVVIEGFVLMTFKGKCPLTVLGYKYSDNQDVGFDIFIPKWLAKNNKLAKEYLTKAVAASPVHYEKAWRNLQGVIK